MSLDPNSPASAVTSAANALQNVGMVHALGQQQQQYNQQQLAQNQFYQQAQVQAQQQQQAQHQHQQQVQNRQQFTTQDLQQQQQQQQQQHQQQLASVYGQQASYAQAAQQLAQHLPHATGLAPPGNPHSLQQMHLPQTEFDTRSELVTYIHQYAKDNGFGIVISHSNEKAIYFTCELGGTYRNKRNINDKERKRKLTTRKINCPFSMVANCKKNDNDEVVKWMLRITNADHNHDKLNLNESYPMLRRRNPDINRRIRELYLKGNKPLQIEKLLKDEFKDILINREDIYNETRKMKREEKGKTGHSPTVSQQHEQNAAAQLKAIAHEHGSFEQNIPSLLEQGIPLNLSAQYGTLPAQQQNYQQQMYQQNVVNQALANAQQNQKDDALSNIDISLVKQ
ncbi:CYFA0S21e01244g1_1 [Cyberlindnera fabianii]|uniref:CYFA0S21e01244g1_1 n=1 Tax=Cyberlindnera fabianii TaxID=36022 RepID=A0A061B9G9_CYBFA|nr:CYFA0S21e01244g1_1 [Cyberlindnera fabianii]